MPHKRRWSILVLISALAGLGCWYFGMPARISAQDADAQPAKVSALTAGDLNQACICDLSAASTVRLRLVNWGLRGDVLLGVSSPSAEQAELRRTAWEGNTPFVERLEKVEVPPLSEIHFRPGAYMIHLGGLRGDLKPGDVLELVLRFERLGDMRLAVPVGEGTAP